MRIELARDAHRKSEMPYSASMTSTARWSRPGTGYARSHANTSEPARRALRRRPVREAVGREEERAEESEPRERAAPWPWRSFARAASSRAIRRASDTVKMPHSSMRWSILRKPARATSWSSSACVRRRITHAPPRWHVRPRAISSSCGCHGWPGVDEQPTGVDRVGEPGQRRRAPARCRERARRGPTRCRSWAAARSPQGSRDRTRRRARTSRSRLEAACADQRGALLDVELAVVAQQDGIGRAPQRSIASST